MEVEAAEARWVADEKAAAEAWWVMEEKTVAVAVARWRAILDVEAKHKAEAEEMEAE